MLSQIAFIFHWGYQDMMEIDMQDLIEFHKNSIKLYEDANKTS